jgi:hypothetical protein
VPAGATRGRLDEEILPDPLPPRPSPCSRPEPMVRRHAPPLKALLSVPPHVRQRCPDTPTLISRHTATKPQRIAILTPPPVPRADSALTAGPAPPRTSLAPVPAEPAGRPSLAAAPIPATTTRSPAHARRTTRARCRAHPAPAAAGVRGSGMPAACCPARAPGCCAVHEFRDGPYQRPNTFD